MDQILNKLADLKDTDKIVRKSSIIEDDGLTKIRNWMPKPVKELQLLYRGSENEFSVQKFHEKCDGKEDTITIV